MKGGEPLRQELRRGLVPSADAFPLEELMREVDAYGELTGNKAMVTIENRLENSR